jgi:hypothetical protein
MVNPQLTKSILLPIAVLALLVTAPSPVHSGTTSSPDTASQTKPCLDGQKMAIDFLNSYHQQDFKSEKESIKWISRNPYLSQKFKAEYINLITEARKQDPELGLDADPILDAQDSPDSGFVLKKDLENGYYILAGKDWKEFEVTARISRIGHKCLVDGAGIIHIPKPLRAPR